MRSIIILIIVLFAINSNAQQNYLDTSFGTNGISLSPSFVPSMMALQDDYKILVTGKAASGNATKIYRFNADGNLDQNFGNNGIVPAGGANEYTGIRQLSDHKIVIVGTRAVNVFGVTSGTIVFARFNPDGIPDTSFGTNGILGISDFAEQSDQQRIASAVKVKFLPNGSIVCVGRIGRTHFNPVSNGPTWTVITGPLIAKFNPDMTLDTTFAGTGYLKLPSSIASQFNALDVYPDGSIIAGLQKNGNIRLYKYLPTGDADVTFGTEGMQVIDIGTNNDWISDIKIVTDGKILVSGSKVGNSRDAFLARLNADGSLDPTYGTGGILAFTNDSGQPENAVETLVIDNGRVITGLQKWDNDFDFQSVFTTTAGAIDSSVANEGWLSTPMAYNERLTCMMQQPDGKIVVAGYNENNCIVMRYDLNSSLGERSFDTTKISVYPNPAPDNIFLSGIVDNTPVAFYNISGQKVLEVVTSDSHAMDISSLTPGIYMLKTAKGCKKIIKN